jgi:hypothetical protein
MRWVGIDEAGYGPNLGPMVMTAVVAEAKSARNAPKNAAIELDLWRDLAATVDRAGGDPARLWVDDSKAILRGRKGRDQLERTCLAAVHAANRSLPQSFAELLCGLGVGVETNGDGHSDAELTTWLDRDCAPRPWPDPEALSAAEKFVATAPLAPANEAWCITAIRSVVVGPRRFNAGLDAHGVKSAVHFDAFARLLEPLWALAEDGVPTLVKSDKHGGRHYYMPGLSRCIPDAWIDRGPEGPESSSYTVRDRHRRLELCVMPRADASDGLVALASIVSKMVREIWMDIFNAFWQARVPGLRPTAGYHNDAHRFRNEIEAAPGVELPDASLWWRSK